MLFVTGRLKDMIILRGRNVYPQDVEWTAERCHPSLCAGGAAAFAVEVDGEEQLAIVQELNRHFDKGVIGEIIAAIRQEISDQFDIEVHAIRLIQPLSLPKTSSGKVQRHVCRQGFLAGSLEIVAEWTRQKAAGHLQASRSSDPTEQSNVGTSVGLSSVDAIVAWLTERISGPLGIRTDEVDTRKPLASYGLGSLQAVQLASQLEQWLGLKLSPTLAYDYPTIDALAHFLSGSTCSQKEGRMAQSACRKDREPIAIIGIGCRFPGRMGRWDSGNFSVTESKLLARYRPHAGMKRLLGVWKYPGAGASWQMSTSSMPTSSAFLPARQSSSTRNIECCWRSRGKRWKTAGWPPSDWPAVRWACSLVFPRTTTPSFKRCKAARRDGYRITGSAASIAADRISHHFDFRGPSLTIDTACSSSMVAVHLACKSLWDGECDLAVAGGVNLILVPEGVRELCQGRVPIA